MSNVNARALAALAARNRAARAAAARAPLSPTLLAELRAAGAAESALLTAERARVDAAWRAFLTKRPVQCSDVELVNANASDIPAARRVSLRKARHVRKYVPAAVAPVAPDTRPRTFLPAARNVTPFGMPTVGEFVPVESNEARGNARHGAPIDARAIRTAYVSDPTANRAIASVMTVDVADDAESLATARGDVTESAPATCTDLVLYVAPVVPPRTFHVAGNGIVYLSPRRVAFRVNSYGVAFPADAFPTMREIVALDVWDALQTMAGRVYVDPSTRRVTVPNNRFTRQTHAALMNVAILRYASEAHSRVANVADDARQEILRDSFPIIARYMADKAPVYGPANVGEPNVNGVIGWEIVRDDDSRVNVNVYGVARYVAKRVADRYFPRLSSARGATAVTDDATVLDTEAPDAFAPVTSRDIPDAWASDIDKALALVDAIGGNVTATGGVSRDFWDALSFTRNGKIGARVNRDTRAAFVDAVRAARAAH